MSASLPVLTCREVLDFLDDYIEGALPEDRRLLFGQHLAACAACREYLSQYLDTIRLGRRAFSVVDLDRVPFADPPEDLIRAILRARRSL